MRLYPLWVSRRFVYTRLEYNGDASLPGLGYYEMRLYPPRVLRRYVYTCLGYFGDASIPA